ncbi:MAG: hypothetical protein FJW30_19580 [Acidobacteria bacterium]|nr:hypothetical protein [Acidobacteriota bacterium]
MKLFVTHLAWLLLAAAPAFSQSFTASLSGLAEDATGAVVPGVAITVTDLDKNTRFRTVSNETGFYVSPALPPGRYRVVAEKDGFRTFVFEPLALATQQRAQLNVRLEVGAVVDRVEVTGTAQMLESTSSTLSSVVGDKAIRDLPLNSRNIIQLAFTVPGVFSEAPLAQAGSAFTFMSNRFIVNGGQNETSDVLVDGVSASVPHNNPSMLAISAVPSVEGVQEFRVQTNSFSAEYGRSGGGVVTLATRSGTNEIHGSLFEFLRNSRFDANSWQANNAGIKLASFKRNQFGGSLGGPILIPKIYDGRNKTFFFVVADFDRTRAAAARQFTVPTELERSGDMSQTFAANGQRKVAYNPFTTRPDPARAGAFLRDPFPGAIVPAAMFNPVALNTQKFYPLPNGAGLPFTRANNLVVQTTLAQPTNRAELKVDHNFNDRRRMFGRYTLLDTITASPNFFKNEAMPHDGDLDQRLQNAALDFTETLSPAMVLNLRYGFGRTAGTRNPAGTGFSPTKLGLPGSIDQVADAVLFPMFNVQDVTQLGPGGGAYWRMRNYSHSFIANVAKVSGRHSLKVGMDARLNFVNFLQLGTASGQFNFTRAETQGPDPRTPSAIGGIGYAGFLLGVGNGGNLNKTIMGANANRYAAFYINDDFKVSSKLTLNLGFRWDFETGVTERYNRVGGIDPVVRNPVSDAVKLELTGGYVYPGKGIDGRGIRSVYPKQINPRFGLAYQLDSNTVIRGGYGIFFGVPSYTANPRFVPGGFSANTPWIAQAADGVTPLNLLGNPFPTGYVLPEGNIRGLQTQLGTALSGPWPDALIPSYNQQWNFTIQRLLPKEMLVEVAYAGNKGTHLPISANLNQLPSSLLSRGNDLLTQVPNPFLGVINVGVLSLPTVQRGLLLRPNAQFTSVTAVAAGWGNSNYHSLQSRFEKRFSGGFGFMTSFTWSKTITDGVDGAWSPNGVIRDNNCRTCDRAISSFDQPLRLVFSTNYELPFGRGKALGTGLPKWADAMFGQWQVNGVLTISSGLPLILSVPQNTSFSFGGNQTPDASGVNPNLGSNKTLRRWFDTAQFSQPRNFTLGTMGRVSSNLRADSAQNIDFSLFKTFAIRDRARVVFRAEAFNLANHPLFAAPGGTVNTPLFGVVTAQANSPRQVQLGLKVIF